MALLYGRRRLLLHRFALRVLATLLRSRSRRVDRRERAGDGPIRIVLFDAYALGGTQRSVFMLAERLAAAGHDVSIVSLIRGSDEPFFDVPPGVRLEALDDRRSGTQPSPLARALGRLPTVLMHPMDAVFSWYTGYDDWALAKALRAPRRGIVITTRPAFNLLAATLCRSSVVVVAQEHMNLDKHPAELRDDLAAHYARLDAVATLTPRDQSDYRGMLTSTDVEVFQIYNGVPALEGTPRAERLPHVVAMGRFNGQKAFDRLITAFKPVHDKHPDWRLVIYGEGREQPLLEQTISSLGLADAVELPGPTTTPGEMLSSASIYAMSSRYEGFPMVLIEAMSKGIAIATFDCPTGPREAITDGVEGLLVPPDDIDALSAGLLRLIEDPDLRQRLGTAAQQRAKDFSPEVFGRRWIEALRPWTGRDAA